MLARKESNRRKERLKETAGKKANMAKRTKKKKWKNVLPPQSKSYMQIHW